MSILISYCTAIRDRLEHLSLTLPSNVKDNPGDDTEFVIYDSGSKDDLVNWLQKKLGHELDSGKVRLISGPAIPQQWCAAVIKNQAHGLARGRFVCNIDADNYATTEFTNHLREVFNQDANAVVSYRDKLAWGGGGGRIALSRENFTKLGGYDESFNATGGWGYEDLDLVDRATAFGLTNRMGQGSTLKFIKHDDSIRLQHIIDKDKMKTNKLMMLKSANNIKLGQLIAN